MMFGPIKSVDALVASAEKKSLRRSLGVFQLIMLGVGAVIGTGIFVLSANAAQHAGPGMMLSFTIAGLVCAAAALCYAELASMIPVAGSAYTYTYAVVGETLAWMVGWAMCLEYVLGASMVAVGWSGYFSGMLAHLSSFVPFLPDIVLPKWLEVGPAQGGLINLPAALMALAMTGLLILGTKESARFNAVLVGLKISALCLFVAVALPSMNTAHFEPFMPTGFLGVAGAAASIFGAYMGFDAVSTAAEETVNPRRNIPIALIGSLLLCTLFYVVVAAAVTGAPLGAQPVRDAAGVILEANSVELAQRCQAIVAAGSAQPVACSREALAYILRGMDWPIAANLVAIAAVFAFPSVLLMLMFGQTRIAFTMARDGLLPPVFAKLHKRFSTPHIVTMVTGVLCAGLSAFVPVGQLAGVGNTGMLFAFGMVAVVVLVLRVKEPDRHRPFRAPLLWVIAPSAILGCTLLFASLDLRSILVLPIWGALGLAVYFLYGRSHSLAKLALESGAAEAASGDAAGPGSRETPKDVPS